MNTPAQKGARAGLRAGVSERLSNPHGLNLAAGPGDGDRQARRGENSNCRPPPSLREAKFGNRPPMRPLSLLARCAGGIRQRAPAREMLPANGKKKDKGMRGYQSRGMVRQRP